MKQQFDGIIFDMDGVLVTNASYECAIQFTVQTILEKTKRLKVSVGIEYIKEIKKITGFNNDWDTSFALIKLLGNKVTIDKFRKEVKQVTPEIRRSSDYVYIKNVFQDYYLGNNYDGLITQESLLIDTALLKTVSTEYTLGIATSRPKNEALFAVKNLGISPEYVPELFVVGKEDTKREKPFPDPLLEAMRRMNVTNPVYVGDTINDVVAAKNAKMKCIFVGAQKLGDIQISNVNQLQEVLL